MASFAINVVDRPEISCAGIMVATTMDKAMADCPVLWAAFGPRMGEIVSDAAYAEESFGPSVMTGETAFDYWAAKQLPADGAVPEGMRRITLPAGRYIECELKSLEEMGAAYTYIYEEWPKEHPENKLDMKGVGYEVYTPEFMKTGKLTLYCPLLSK